MKTRTIFITGGHFDAAKAVIDQLRQNKGWKIFYLGRRFAMEDDKAEALEYQEIRKIPDVSYLVLNTGRLQPKFFVNVGQSIRSLFKIFIGLTQTPLWLLKYRPDIVLSFGGYLAVPVLLWAWVFGIPIVTHEQTLVSGRANRFVGFLANKILVSWPDSLSHFPSDKKVVLTGNPLRAEILAATKIQPKTNKKPAIYITGGNQGSHVLNLAVEESLPDLLRRYSIVHQTGEAQNAADFSRLEKFKSPNYQVAKFFSGQQVGQILVNSDLVVTRAGANITKEILALGKMALFIPIPWSAGNEQQKNAQLVKDLGLAEILPQVQLSGKTLKELITKMIENKEIYQANAAKAKKLGVPDAARRIVNEIEKEVQE